MQNLEMVFYCDESWVITLSSKYKVLSSRTDVPIGQLGIHIWKYFLMLLFWSHNPPSTHDLGNIDFILKGWGREYVEERNICVFEIKVETQKNLFTTLTLSGNLDQMRHMTHGYREKVMKSALVMDNTTEFC